MPEPPGERITQLLQSWQQGNARSADELVPLVYAELRKMARIRLNAERQGHTLQPTALVHEAYIRLSEQNAGWQNRSHFFAVSAEIMRRILVDHARARLAAKRPQKRMQVTVIPEDAAVSGPRELDLMALDAALDELAAVAPRQVQMVVLRFFGGLTHEEIASELGLSLSTVNREWRLARAWLYQRVAA
jgi:RNA polymerase sigma factor (TIGR02999 family)